jgi:hypothetical protein
LPKVIKASKVSKALAQKVFVIPCQVFRCDECDVAVSTSANYDLHVSGEWHRKNLEAV